MRAGLLSALPGSDRWPQVVLTPTSEPLRVLGTHLAMHAGTTPEEVADRLEPAFTDG